LDRPIIAPEDGLDDRVMLMACAGDGSALYKK
jgi:hypothetical protein